MINFRYLVLSLFLVVFAFFNANAQSNNKHKGKAFANSSSTEMDTRAKDFTDTLQKVLSLTSTQYEKIMFINKDFYSKRDAVRSAAKADTVVANKSQYKQQTKTLQKIRRAAIEAELTTEQKTTWQVWRKQNVQTKKVNAKNAKKPKVDEDDEM